MAQMEEHPWRVCVPLSLDPLAEEPWKEYALAMQRMGVERVFLNAPGLKTGAEDSPQIWQKYADLLRERTRFFAGFGIAVGFWLGPTLGWDVLGTDRPHPYQELVGPRGDTAPGISCPLDSRFRAHLCDQARTIASSGVDLIILEDDFRLHLRAPAIPIGCFCPLHLADLEARTGIRLEREQVVEKVLCGPPNPVREAFLASTGGSLMLLAREIEQAVHAVNPACRIGQTLVMSHWCHEGLDVPSLLKTLAGNTRPFARTIGAPYWTNEPWETGFLVEFSRLQARWLRGTDAEIVAEGDPFPHTRFFTPAAALQAFEQGLLAAGFPGVLRYPFAYAPRPGHETGYVEAAVRTTGHDRALRRFFPPEYHDWGVHPALRPNDFPQRTLPAGMSDGEMGWPDEPVWLHFLPRLGIPLGWDDRGPAVLCGDSSASLETAELERLLGLGCILDAPAAFFLGSRGVDVGVASLEPVEAPRFELYEDPEFCGGGAGDHIWLITAGKGVFFRLVLKPGARTITRLCGPDGSPHLPGAVHYENAGGQRFCILPFDLRRAGWRGKGQEMINYCRQEQLQRSLGWVARRPLPAAVRRVPNVHLACRAAPDGSRLAIGIQNLCLDPIVDPEIILASTISIPEEIEVLAHGADRVSWTREFEVEPAGEVTRLRLRGRIPAMGMIGVGLRQW